MLICISVAFLLNIIPLTHQQELLAVFYKGNFYKKKQKLKWGQNLTHNALNIVHGIKQRTKHFDSII